MGSGVDPASCLVFNTPGITLRSVSGDREVVERGEVTRGHWLKTARKLDLGKQKTSRKRGKRIDSAWTMLLEVSREEHV